MIPAKSAGRSLFALISLATILLVGGLLSTAIGAVNATIVPAAAQELAAAHVFENWPGPILRVRLPRHLAGRQGARVRAKARSGHSGSAIADLASAPALPAHRAGKISAPWQASAAPAEYRPRPYDSQGPPRQVV